MPPVVVYHKYWFSSLAEHYVFPDDRPAEDQHEVRTVEEESLFRAAYPEVVESYLRDKALAEENKTKSKTMSYKSLLVHKHTIFSTIWYFLWNSPCSPPPPQTHRLDKLQDFPHCADKGVLIKGTLSFDLFFKAVYYSSPDTWKCRVWQFDWFTHQRLWCSREVSVSGFAVTLGRLYSALPPHHNCCRAPLPNVQENYHWDWKRFAVKSKYVHSSH